MQSHLHSLGNRHTTPTIVLTSLVIWQITLQLGCIGMTNNVLPLCSGTVVCALSVAYRRDTQRNLVWHKNTTSHKPTLWIYRNVIITIPYLTAQPGTDWTYSLLIILRSASHSKQNALNIDIWNTLNIRFYKIKLIRDNLKLVDSRIYTAESAWQHANVTYF